MGLFSVRRPEPQWKHPDPKLRLAAVGRLDDPALLASISREDDEPRVRQRAAETLRDLALEARVEVALEALAALEGEPVLLAVAKAASHEEVARRALLRLPDPKALGAVARQARHPSVRMEAIARLEEISELASVALKSDHPETALGALDRIAILAPEDPSQAMAEALEPVARRARCKPAARRARTMLRMADPDSGEAAPAPHPTDRRRQEDLCATMAQLSRAEVPDGVAARIAETRDAWIDLVPEVDDDLQERFDRELAAAREHLVRLQEEAAERRRREREAEEHHERHVAPRLALCEALEGAPEEEIPQRLEDARWEWERLAPLAAEEGQALEERFRAAVAAAAERRSSWEKNREEARRTAEQEAARRDRERREQQGLDRIRQLCARLERLDQARNAGLKSVARALRDARAQLDQPGPHPPGGEWATLRRRLEKLHAGLQPRLGELREKEDWRRWANTGIQEDLCRKAEDLREVTDPLEAARRLTEIQGRWRAASSVSRERALTLWNRFKAARDDVRTRLDAARAEHAARKEDLCKQAEALADSTDWIATAETLKRLQAEWKTVGQARRSADRALWERFHGACDRFFTRRKEDLKRLRETRARNLSSRIGLCERAEALADSTDWEATAAEIKKLQSEWKALGPTDRKHAEAVWQRFRAAGNRFFDRYRRRDQIETEQRAEQRTSLCRELEALIPGAPLSESTLPNGAGGPPVSDPSPSEEAVRESLRGIWKRWQEAPHVPGAPGAALEERFGRSLETLAERIPAVREDGEFDGARNRARLEEICTRVEKLVPGEGGVDDTAASPAARLAAMWVEAMATNTIGGRAAEEAKWRAAAEEVHRAQAAWRRVGYVPPEARRTLTDRFERVCRRIQQQAESIRPPEVREERRPRRRRT